VKDNIIYYIMGNLFCCNKKDSKLFKKDDLLNNTIHCHYCNRTMLFNDYYKHLNSCKRENIEYYNKFGDL